MAIKRAPSTAAELLNRATAWLVAAEVVLITSVALCLRLVAPIGDVQTNGLSVYGTRARTLLPYGIGMVAVACGVFAAGRLAERAAIGTGLPALLRQFGVLVIGLLITPYTWGTLMNWTHMLLGIALFVGQLSLSGWLAVRLQHPLLWLLFALQLGGDLVAFASLPGVVDALLFGEIVAQVSFLPLLAVALRSLAQYHCTQTHTSPTRSPAPEWGGSP